MRHTNKKSLLGAGAGSATTAPRPPLAADGWWRRLTKPRGKAADRLKRRELVFILRNLATLTGNGVSLPKALGTLAEEKPLERHRGMLLSLRRHLENGESFSLALAQYPSSFDTIMINQVKVGERSGSLSDTLSTIATHCDEANRLRSEIVRKLSYPTILVVMGTGVIAFLLMYVVPVFEETYSNAKVPLPMITQLLIGAGGAVKSYSWLVVLLVTASLILLRQLRKRPAAAKRMDQAILRWPVVGHWLRDIAVLRLMEVLRHLMEAGFTLSEALGEAVQSVSNRAVQQGARDLQSAVRRGERFSREIERHGDLFPPIVSQLVIVGEQTGKLGIATKHICEHLEREITRKTNLFVGTIEPVLTIFLASAVAVILLSIYLPMFDMIQVVGK